MSEPADRVLEPSEEHPDRPDPQPAEQNDVFAPSRGLEETGAMAARSGAVPPAAPPASAEPSPHAGPETGPSGAEPRNAERS